MTSIPPSCAVCAVRPIDLQIRPYALTLTHIRNPAYGAPVTLRSYRHGLLANRSQLHTVASAERYAGEIGTR